MFSQVLALLFVLFLDCGWDFLFLHWEITGRAKASNDGSR
jgi:hypothetical protein